MSVSPKWLHDAWFGTATFQVLPRIIIQKNRLSVVVFRQSGAAMRIRTCQIKQGPEDVIFQVPNAMRAYIKQCLDFPAIRLDVSLPRLRIVIEMGASAIQYHFPNIERADDVHIEPHENDMTIHIPTGEWIAICKTMPVKGTLSICTTHQKRAVTLQHSKGRWVAGTTAAEPSPKGKTFQCNSGVMKFIHQQDIDGMMSDITFMHCGVLRIETTPENIIYLAPIEE